MKIELFPLPGPLCIAETLIGFEIDEMVVKQTEQYIHLPMERKGYSGADSEFTWDIDFCSDSNNPVIINEDQQLVFQPGETKLKIPLSISQFPSISEEITINFKLTNSNVNFIPNLRELKVKIKMNVPLPKVGFISKNYSAKQSDEFAIVNVQRSLFLPVL